ncbi:YkvA family protein [Marinicrinis sediminis]|uniref:YkvA family protein n=1 Tax=Marinicrinis sediminis TaxID=1652465 RepID=A0ABW5R9Z7_9BACL
MTSQSNIDEEHNNNTDKQQEGTSNTKKHHELTSNMGKELEVRSHMNEESESYQAYYSDEGFWRKVRKKGKKAGKKTVYSGLLLYYALQSPHTPLKAKIQIYGALGYFILPLDLIPDLIPAVGYTDDLSALAWAIGMVAMNISQEMKDKARQRVDELFGDAEHIGEDETPLSES